LPCGCSPVENPVATKNEVIEISLKTLPMPDYSTPWEQILEYRSDSDSRVKFTRLRQWMSKVAQVKNKPNEVEEEVQTLIDDYSQHMKMHRIKTRLDTLKAIVVAEVGLFTGGWLTGIGALPGIIGIVANPLYSIRQRQVEITAEELKAPGREVAYIVESNEAFSTHDGLEENGVCELCGGGSLD
jgi:ABC-type Fe3+-hydroxamate transport system substrate-binding protein